MKKIITKISIAAAALAPSFAFAQQKDLKYLIDLTVVYFNYAVYLTIGLATVLFVWNVYKYFISGSDNAESKKEAGMYVLWSVVGFFVILSFWGMVNILTGTFKLDNNQPSGFFGNFSSSGSNTGVSTPRSNTGVSTPARNTGVSTPANNTTIYQSSSESKGILRTLWGIIY